MVNYVLGHMYSLLTAHCASVSVLSLTSCSVVVLAAEGCVSLQKLSHHPHPEDGVGVGSEVAKPQKPGSDSWGQEQIRNSRILNLRESKI